MGTAILHAEINKEDIPFLKKLLKNMKAKNIVLQEEKDDTKMTKEEFYTMIKEASKSIKTKRTREERKAFLGL